MAMARKLGTDEQALWARVAATVRPLGRGPAVAQERLSSASAPRPALREAGRTVPAPHLARSATIGDSLDAGWERRLARGLVQPDLVVDLHGRSMAGAHDLLERRIDEAAARGIRLILLVTGKPPRSKEGPAGRGAIRASVIDWLAASRHSSRIAAIRKAHARHGGPGALYLVLRRRSRK